MREHHPPQPTASTQHALCVPAGVPCRYFTAIPRTKRVFVKASCARAERRAAGPLRQGRGAGRRACAMPADARTRPSEHGEPEALACPSTPRRHTARAEGRRSSSGTAGVAVAPNGYVRAVQRATRRAFRRRDAFRRAAQRATRLGVTSDDATGQRAAGDVRPAAQTTRCWSQRAGAGHRARVEAQACSVEGRRRVGRPYQRKRVSTPVPRHEFCTPAPR
jgi:hypothetical protein